MTFFIDGPKEPPKIKARMPGADPASFWGGTAAAFGKAQLENDSNFRAKREFSRSQEDIAWSAAERLGLDAITARAEEMGFYDHIRPAPQSLEEGFHRDGYEMTKIVLDMAREQASDNPEAWQDMNLSEDAMWESANERMRAEYEEAQAILEMMPGGQGMAEFVGGMAGITADIKNLPFMLIGGGSGSIGRVAMREAAINMAAEAAFLPAQFKQAERLEIPDPDVASQLAMAAGAGAVLGGGLEAGRRGLTYWKNRNRVKTLLRGYDDLETQAAVDKVEDVIAQGGPDPIGEAARVTEQFPPKPPEITPMEPLILRPQDRVDAPTGPRVDADTPEPVETATQAVEALDDAIVEAQAADSRFVRPLAQYLKSNHKPTKAAIREAEKAGRPAPVAGENLQINPDGFVGQELKARGITAKTFPGLFSREKGRKDFDNLVASEWEETFPGIMEATGTKYGDNYLDRDGFVDVLARDLEGDSSWLRSRKDVMDLERQAAEAEYGNPTDDFLSGKEAEYGFFVDTEMYEFNFGYGAKDAIARDVSDWMRENGYFDALTDAERAEIIAEVQNDGGDVEYLVERVMERSADYVDLPAEKAIRYEDDIPFGEPTAPQESPVGSLRGGEGRPGENPQATGNGRPDAEPDRSPVSEGTEAGEQYLIDGVEPVSVRDRLETAQNAQMRGGDANMDVGLFDTGARAQVDMFDDVTSPEARVIQDSVADDIRADIEKTEADFLVDMDDGLGKRSMSTVLDELEADDEFLEIAKLCGRPKA